MNKYLLTRKDREAMAETVVQHQFNGNAIRHTRTLTSKMGLTKLGLHIVRIQPGRDSTTHHYHEADEEFIYILSGQGVARIGEDRLDIGTGDFMAFPVGGPAHSLNNNSDEDLVYLVGGERNLPDIVHYPEIEKSMVKSAEGRRWSDWKDIHPLPPR